jgi:predicted dehydrogenase
MKIIRASPPFIFKKQFWFSSYKLSNFQGFFKINQCVNPLINKNMKAFFSGISLLALFFSVSILPTAAQVLKVGVVGLNHDHVHGILNQFKKGEVVILGIAESDKKLIARYEKNYMLPDSLFYPSVSAMLDHIKPDAVLAYNAIVDHLSVVEACAPRGISVMVEKPLATSVSQADRMQELVKKYHIRLLTNYETTWYPTNQAVYDIMHIETSSGPIRRMIVHSGHQGPKEIGCSPDFLQWLTDPIKNGGGAVMDFGCYGANLMTWLMNEKAPIAVTAYTRHIKPSVYPKVDDDASIILEYPGAMGFIEASWNWPFGIKDLEVFGQTTYVHALNGTDLLRRDSTAYFKVPAIPLAFPDNLTYLAAVLSGKLPGEHDLSSLENNLIVVRILEAARQSAKEGKRILLEQ